MKKASNRLQGLEATATTAEPIGDAGASRTSSMPPSSPRAASGSSPRSSRFPPGLDQCGVLDRLAAQHGLDWPGFADIDPESTKFQDSDFRWLIHWRTWLPDRFGIGKWPGLVPFRKHTAEDDHVYTTAHVGDGTIEVALFADFANGTYQALGTARQLESPGYPEVFYLGDVYYSGKKHEFAEYLAKPLETLLQRSRLYCIPENHELYSGGKYYLEFIDSQPNVPQRGSYFCVRYPHHQFIGLDVNWQGRKRLDKTSVQLEWLRQVLESGEGRTNVLLTGSAPYTYGSRKPSRILTDLKDFLGEIDLWFWGDDHYCALFDRSPKAPFVGSCIGHAGHPFERQVRGAQTLDVDCLFIEDESRFPGWTGLRPDRGNNGFCELELHPDGGVTITYVDWLGERRCRTRFNRVELDDHRCRLELDKEPFHFTRAREDESFDDLIARGVLHGR